MIDIQPDRIKIEHSKRERLFDLSLTWFLSIAYPAIVAVIAFGKASSTENTKSILELTLMTLSSLLIPIMFLGYAYVRAWFTERAIITSESVIWSARNKKSKEGKWANLKYITFPGYTLDKLTLYFEGGEKIKVGCPASAMLSVEAVEKMVELAGNDNLLSQFYNEFNAPQSVFKKLHIVLIIVLTPLSALLLAWGLLNHSENANMLGPIMPYVFVLGCSIIVALLLCGLYPLIRLNIKYGPIRKFWRHT
jgi:hypothetical protein